MRHMLENELIDVKYVQLQDFRAVANVLKTQIFYKIATAFQTTPVHIATYTPDNVQKIAKSATTKENAMNASIELN